MGQNNSIVFKSEKGALVLNSKDKQHYWKTNNNSYSVIVSRRMTPLESLPDNTIVYVNSDNELVFMTKKITGSDKRAYLEVTKYMMYSDNRITLPENDLHKANIRQVILFAIKNIHYNTNFNVYVVNLNETNSTY